jgi:hypothetical protein
MKVVVAFVRGRECVSAKSAKTRDAATETTIPQRADQRVDNREENTIARSQKMESTRKA